MGNVVRPQGYIDRFGVDALRYFVFREMVFGQDANFADEAFLTRYNADLANDLGNLVSRATTMIHRYCGGVVPRPDATLAAREPEQRARRGRSTRLIGSVQAAVRAFQLSAALREIWDVIGATNRYIVTREPWALAKAADRRAELDTALYRRRRRAARDRRAAASVHAGHGRTDAADARRRARRPTSWAGLARGHARRRARRSARRSPLFPRIEQSVEELRQMADSDPGGEATERRCRRRSPAPPQAQPPSTLQAQPPSTLQAQPPQTIASRSTTS